MVDMMCLVKSLASLKGLLAVSWKWQSPISTVYILGLDQVLDETLLKLALQRRICTAFKSLPIIASCRQSLKSTRSTVSAAPAGIHGDNQCDKDDDDDGDDDVGDQDDHDNHLLRQKLPVCFLSSLGLVTINKQ